MAGQPLNATSASAVYQTTRATGGPSPLAGIHIFDGRALVMISWSLKHQASTRIPSRSGQTGNADERETDAARAARPPRNLGVGGETGPAVGALATPLGSHNRMVFAGAIGEHAAPVCGSICRGLKCLGISLDPVANAANDPRMSADGSDCELVVIPRHEERMLAQHCRRVLANLENTS